jgi:acyl-CoA reductase-like NAD-dependent aldehyde dehydrogenase
MTENLKEYPFFLGGDWRKNPDPVIIRSPYDRKPVGLVHQAREKDLEDAATASANSFEELRALSSAKRSAMLSSMAAGIDDRAGELTDMLVLREERPAPTPPRKCGGRP